LSYSTIKVEFWYFTRGFDENNDDSFHLETHVTGNDTWSTVHIWVYGEESFDSNLIWRYASVEFPVLSSSDLQIRFRNNGDDNKEGTLIDEVAVSGK
jgi:hypothetical protein